MTAKEVEEVVVRTNRAYKVGIRMVNAAKGTTRIWETVMFVTEKTPFGLVEDGCCGRGFRYVRYEDVEWISAHD